MKLQVGVAEHAAPPHIHPRPDLRAADRGFSDSHLYLIQWKHLIWLFPSNEILHMIAILTKHPKLFIALLWTSVPGHKHIHILIAGVYRRIKHSVFCEIWRHCGWPADGLFLATAWMMIIGLHTTCTIKKSIYMSYK